MRGQHSARLPVQRAVLQPHPPAMLRPIRLFDISILRVRIGAKKETIESDYMLSWGQFGKLPGYFPNTVNAAVVIASVAVAIVTSGSGAQKGLWSEGNLVMSPFTASHFACGTPPTQNSRL